MDDNDLKTIDNNKPSSWNFIDVLLIVFGIGVIFALGFFIFGVIVSSNGNGIPQGIQPNAFTSLWLTALETIALVGSVYLIGLVRKGYHWKEMGYKPTSIKWLLGSAGISLLGIPVSGVIALIILQVFNIPMNNPQLDFLLPKDFTWLSGLGLVILGGIFVPFAEELFFRGILYNWFKEHWGVWPSAILSALLFGVAHGDLLVGTIAFILGIVLALVYEYSHSLWNAFMIHAVNNSARIILLYLLLALGLLTGQ